jgi:hypothetical protein
MDQAAVLAHIISFVSAVGSVRAFARKAGLSEVHVRDVLQGRRTPGPRLLASVGVERRVTYVVVGGDA